MKGLGGRLLEWWRDRRKVDASRSRKAEVASSENRIDSARPTRRRTR